MCLNLFFEENFYELRFKLKFLFHFFTLLKKSINFFLFIDEFSLMLLIKIVFFIFIKKYFK
jgi:hypothetical protein